MHELPLPHRRSFLRLDLLRLVRDVKSVVAFVAILGVPVIGSIYGGSAFHLHVPMSLFLPVLVGWSWGRDLAAGTLAPLAYGAIKPTFLLRTRCAALALLTLSVHGIAALISLSDSIEILAGLAFAMHMLLFGFMLTTIFRSAEVGWLPAFVAFAGVWLPIIATLRRTGGEIPQPWLHALAVMFVPSIAASLGFTTTTGAMLLHIGASVVWSAVAILAITRDGAIR